MVAYIAGSCSPAEKVDFESHCLSCDECLATLAIILRLLHFPVCKEEETTLALLYPIGHGSRKSRPQGRNESLDIRRGDSAARIAISGGGGWRRRGRAAAATRIVDLNTGL